MRYLQLPSSSRLYYSYYAENMTVLYDKLGS